MPKNSNERSSNIRIYVITILLLFCTLASVSAEETVRDPTQAPTLTSRKSLAPQEDFSVTTLGVIAPRANFSIGSIPGIWTLRSRVTEGGKQSLVYSSRNSSLLVSGDNNPPRPANVGGLVDMMVQHYSEKYQVSKVESAARSVNGLEGTEISGSLLSKDARKSQFVAWTATRNGFKYQCAMDSEDLSRSELRSLARDACASLRQLEKTRLANGYPFKISPQYISPRFPFQVDLGDDGWREFLPLYRGPAIAEYMASLPNLDGWISVFPIDLHGANPSQNDLLTALMAQIGVEFANIEASTKAPFSMDGVTGIEFEFARSDIAKPVQMKCRFVRAGDKAYLMLAAIPLSLIERKLDVFDRLDRIHILSSNVFERSLGEIDAIENRRHNIVFNNLGQNYNTKKQFPLALDSFKRALEFDEANLDSLFGIIGSLGRLGRYSEALTTIDTNALLLNGSYEGVAFRAFCQFQLGNFKEARLSYERAFTFGRRDLEDFRSYLVSLWNLGEKEAALAEASNDPAYSNSVQIVQQLGTLYLKSGELEKALEYFKLAKERAPTDVDTIQGLAETLYRLERHNDAVGYLDNLILTGVDSADIRFLKGRSEVSLNLYRQAKASFELASAMNPADQDISDYLKYVSGLLGQGDNSAIKLEITPVPLPEALAHTYAQNPATEKSDVDASYLFRAQGYLFIPNQERKRTLFYRIRVNTKEGAEAFSTFRFKYNPLREQVYVNELSVSDSDGKILSKGNIDQYFITDDKTSEVADHNKILNVPAPGLAPNRYITLTITYREFGKADSFRFVEYPMFGVYPVIDSAIFVQGNKNLLRWKMPAGAIESVDESSVSWQLRHVKPYVREEMQAELQAFLPFAWISDKSKNWSELASAYGKDIEDRLQIAPAIRSLVASLVEGEKTVLSH